MGKDSKRKWEREYESLKTKNIDEEIKKLEGEINNTKRSLASIKDTKSDEYRTNKMQQKDKEKELSKMKMLKENLPQVERTVKFRDAQAKRLEKLNQDKKVYEASLKETKKLSDEAQKLEDKLAELRAQEAKINEALKSPKLSDEDRKKLEQAKIQNRQQQTQNHNDFSDNQKRLSLKLNNPLPKRDFDKEMQVVKNMISKSNFICRNLMEGKKMEEISVDLKNWKDSRFTDKSNETKNKTENSKPEDGKEEQFTEVDKGVQQQIADQEIGENKPVKVSEFDEKHPRLAKIKNFFKNAYSTVVEKISGFRKKDVLEENEPTNIEPEKKEEKGKEPEGKLTSEQVADRKAEFYKRLTETGKLSNTPSNSKMKEALSEQDKIATHGVKPKDDEGR